MANEPICPSPPSPGRPRRYGCLHLLLAVALAVPATAVAGFFVYRAVFHPHPFKPVQLSVQEERALQEKLDRVDHPAAPPETEPETAAAGDLRPEAYSEAGADRTIRFTERELNALLARNTDLADKLAIDLAPDLVSAKLLLPLEEDLPIFGGKTLRVKTGVAFRYAAGRPSVTLRGVMVMGVPLPNAWLGGLKNVDLVQEFGGDEEFWKAFADGVDSLRIEEGSVVLTLKE